MSNFDLGPPLNDVDWAPLVDESDFNPNMVELERHSIADNWLYKYWCRTCKQLIGVGWRADLFLEGKVARHYWEFHYGNLTKSANKH